jgi:hypothetical protein
MNHIFIFHMQDFTTCHHVNQILFIYLFLFMLDPFNDAVFQTV